MNDRRSEYPAISFGLASFVLGMVGLILFFLPVLGAPISGLGVVLGIIGCCAASIAGRGNLRWSVGGVAVALLALTVNMAIAFAPTEGLGSGVRAELVPYPERSYIPPPAKP